MTTTGRPNTRKPRRIPPAGKPGDPTLIRLSRVRTAQKRIASGYYDRDEVRDRLAELVLAVIRQG